MGDEMFLERRRTTSLPNLAILVDEKSSQGSSGSDASSDEVMAMHVSHDTLLEASRSMERLQMELENREQVIRELVELRAKDITEFEAQLGRVQGELLEERAKLRALTVRYEQEMQQRRVVIPVGYSTGLATGTAKRLERQF